MGIMQAAQNASLLHKLTLVLSLHHGLTKLHDYHLTYFITDMWYSSMVPGNLPSQLEILPTGQTYYQADAVLQAIRAPLIVTVLESYYSIHNEAWTTELQAIFPHLAKLVCSAQPTVRKALGQLMRANLPYALADVPS